MADKPQILAQFNAGDSIYDVDNFCATMNWLISWAANLKAEKGLTWVNRDSDHPTLKTNLKAGKGISITESDGQLTITALKTEDDEDDEEPKDNPKKSGGGNGDGNNPPPLDPPAPQPGPLSPTTPGPDKQPPKSSSNCNQWSEDIGNDSSDSGMDNAGDDCSSLNGW